MKSMLVKDAMKPGVMHIDSSKLARDAAAMMKQWRLRSLVVMDEDCGLAGIITESDIVVAHLLNEGKTDWATVRVADIMKSKVTTVTPNASIKDAAQLMHDHRIHRVVVTEENDLCNPIGILSMGDILRYVEG